MANPSKNEPTTTSGRKLNEPAHENRDPISGESGSHPVGTALGGLAGGVAGGAAVGAAAAALEGAAVGTFVGGPVGTAVGAAVGIIAGTIGGALAGKHVAESIDPTVEHAHWRENYQNRPYVEPGATYDDYGPAYQYGWESRTKHADKTYEDVEPELAQGWDKAKAKSQFNWDKAQPAARDAWDKVTLDYHPEHVDPVDGHYTTIGERDAKAGARPVEPRKPK